MSIIEVSKLDVPLITYNSDDWGDNIDDGDVAEEVINFLKENDYKTILIQNTAYSFGCTEIQPIVMVNSDDFGGFNGTLSTFIKDIVCDLIPEE